MARRTAEVEGWWPHERDQAETGRSRPSPAKAERKRATQDTFSEKYPSLSAWIKHGGWIELGSDSGFTQSYARVLDEGGMLWERVKPIDNLDEVLEAMEAAVRDVE